MKKGTITFFLLLAVLQALSAQEADTDFMRSTGKIYVVVAVIVAIFVGIVLFLIYLDRKLAKLENQINDDD
ncbi:MAG TPA: CcmD family protein [Phaeodactylibacter sp.]|nr:CcmD family protein [Phaeodactylibacter sp.]